MPNYASAARGTVEFNHLFQKDRGKTASTARGTVVFNRLFQKDGGKTASAARGTVELHCLFQKDQGKTASGARILSPNPMQRPLPCLLTQSFFYASFLYLSPASAAWCMHPLCFISFLSCIKVWSILFCSIHPLCPAFKTNFFSPEWGELSVEEYDSTC